MKLLRSSKQTPSLNIALSQIFAKAKGSSLAKKAASAERIRQLRSCNNGFSLTFGKTAKGGFFSKTDYVFSDLSRPTADKKVVGF